MLCALIALLAMPLLTACGPKADHPRIVMISIDTLRADHLGSYGAENKNTPNMDRLTSEGVRFANCRSSAPWTLPSHATMFTGLYPTDHQAIDDKVKIRENATLLTQVLKKNGYKTAAFVSHYYVGDGYGLKRGFDDFWEDEEATGDVIADKAAGWLKKNKDKSFFLFLHIFDPHTPYMPPPSVRVKHLPAEAEWVRGDTADVLRVVGNEKAPETPLLLNALHTLYEGEIDYTDQMLGRILATLDKLEIKNTLVVLTSDHGEEFMEHRLMEHGFTLYDEQLHVPLIFKWTEKLPKNLKVEAPVGLVDLAKTICGLIGVTWTQGGPGQSLVPLMNENAAPEIVASFADRALLAETTRQGPDRMCVIRNGMKYIYSPSFHLNSRSLEPQLFDLKADPLEKNDLLASKPDIARSMLKMLFDTGLYNKRKLFSALFAGTKEQNKYVGTLRTNGAFISAYKDNAIYGTDEKREMISLEFGLKKEEQRLHYLAFGSDGENGVHFFIEPQDAGVEADLLLNDARDAKTIALGSSDAHPAGVPFLFPADIGAGRRTPDKPGFAIWCEEVLVNKNVVTRFEVGDEIVMSKEMIAKLKSLGYLDEGSTVKKGASEKSSAPAATAEDLLKGSKTVYNCKPLDM